jgi:hypothetical protein
MREMRNVYKYVTRYSGGKRSRRRNSCSRVDLLKKQLLGELGIDTNGSR